MKAPILPPFLWIIFKLKRSNWCLIARILDVTTPATLLEKLWTSGNNLDMYIYTHIFICDDVLGCRP